MAYADLKAFIETLRRRGELLEIGEEVDADLEISAFADRAVKAGGPALLFNNVRGYDIRPESLVCTCWRKARKLHP
jgi:4-hydroxy-3-polyprenylbenzoate decarboxylase